MVTDTNPLEKCCSKCDQTKTSDKFIPKRNICKECRNTKCREKYKIVEIDNDSYQTCNSCNEAKLLSSYIRNRNICKDCNNNNRKNKYKTDETHRVKLIKQVTEYKHNKVIERNLLKLQEIGEDNKKCSSCSTIKNMCNFRHNRLKCKDCERDNPIEKFKRIVRSRIYSCLDRKTKHTIEYLGCSCKEYLQWILNDDYTLENRGKEWHIDHVIPLCHFNMEDEEEQKIAFNWRNTAPLTPYENLAKNKKVLKPQIEQHWKKLVEHHEKYNIEMPQKFIDLFAKHLVAGNPLEPSLPLTIGNICEELG